MKITEDKVLENIRRAREAKKMSQTDIGFRLGMDQSSYSQVESGNRKLSLERLLQIAQILETPVENLVGAQAVEYLIPDTKPEIDDKGDLDARYGGPRIRLAMLEREIELLKQQIEDQKKIIRLLEEKCG